MSADIVQNWQQKDVRYIFILISKKLKILNDVWFYISDSEYRGERVLPNGEMIVTYPRGMLRH